MNWRKVKLGEFLIHREDRFKPNEKCISGLKRIDKIDFSGKIYTSDKPSNTDMILVKKGDLVISGINVEKGAMAVYAGEVDLAATIHYSAYRYDNERIDIDYLKYLLKSTVFKNAIKEQVPGGIKTEIKPKHLLPLIVEIPTDINDQKKIVENLHSQYANIDVIELEINNQRNYINRIRQAFLTDAIQGKLVPQDPNDEPASELLKRIKAEKEQLISQGKLKKEKHLPHVKPEEIPFEIPENWIWCKMGEVAYITSGSTPSQDAFVDRGIPYLKMYNLRNQKIDFKYKPQYIKEEVHNGQLKRCRAYPGDLLMNIVGPPLGKIAIIPDDLPQCNFNQAAVLIRPFVKEMNSYIFWFLNEMTEINSIDTKGVAGQNNISVTQAHNMKIPLPPLSEQQRIVAKIDQLMCMCDELEQNIQQNQQYTQQLMQVVLKEALTSSDSSFD